MALTWSDIAEGFKTWWSSPIGQTSPILPFKPFVGGLTGGQLIATGAAVGGAAGAVPAIAKARMKSSSPLGTSIAHQTGVPPPSPGLPGPAPRRQRGPSPFGGYYQPRRRKPLTRQLAEEAGKQAFREGIARTRRRKTATRRPRARPAARKRSQYDEEEYAEAPVRRTRAPRARRARSRRAPTAKQLAARRRFAQRARSGEFRRRREA